MSIPYPAFLLVPVLLVAGLYGAGMLLPATREGRATIEIKADPARIIAIIEDVARQPEWRSDIGRIEIASGGWVETTRRGERISFSWTDRREDRIALAFRSDAGYAGEWIADLEASGPLTRITATERATVDNPFRRIVARLVFNPGDFALTYLVALKAEAEG